MARLMTVDNYAHAREILGTRDSRKLGNNTTLESRGDTVAVRYHATDVVTFHADDSRTLDTGGWFTSTTKERINQYLPWGWHLYADRGTWKLREAGNPVPVLYADGMTVSESAGWHYADGTNPVDAVEADKAMKRRIRTYVAGWTEEVRDTCADTAGDCWACLMVTNDGRTLGDATADTAHLESHLEERYYMASLTLNAIREAGYGNPEVIYWHAPDLARRAMRRYLESRLLTGPTSGRRGSALISENWA